MKQNQEKEEERSEQNSTKDGGDVLGHPPMRREPLTPTLAAADTAGLSVGTPRAACGFGGLSERE